MKKDVLQRYNEWLNSEFIDEEDRKILENMTDDEINESFSSDLEFGTAGIRGIMGLGTNRINKYNIGKVTLGLSNYLNKHYSNSSVVIGYDTRNNSREFAFRTALILNHEGIKTYLFKDVTSTPEVSFAVKYLKCESGIVITSSHNSKIYNGYKVYNNKGSQIIHPEDTEIIKEINMIKDYNIIEEAPLKNPLFNYCEDEVELAFLKENEKVIINKKLIDNYSNKIKITYSSLHGVGIKIIPFIFEKYGIRYNLVNEQCKIDKEFPYAKEPNPEYEFNYDLALKYANELDSDIIIESDPDADRIGIMYKSDNEYKLLNGNMIGCVFLYYLLNNIKVVKDNYVVKSIVTTPLVNVIADYYNAKVIEVLTGCKNIAKIKEENSEKYLFGFEESLGYVFNINVNDKNSISSTIFLIEILCYLKSINSSLDEYIKEINDKFGYYESYTENIIYDGIDGIKKIEYIMKKVREKNIFNAKEIVDYMNRNDNLKTNAIKYIISDNEYFIIRPSGTEPKIKIYYFAWDKSKFKAKFLLDNLIEFVKNKME